MIVIILYITVAFPNHSSRRLLANQKPTTLRKNVAKLNETSLRYFKLILDPERSNQIYRFAIYRGIYLLIIEKLFNCSLSLSLSLIFSRSFSIVHTCITLYSLYYSDIGELFRGQEERELLYDMSLFMIYYFPYFGT